MKTFISQPVQNRVTLTRFWRRTFKPQKSRHKIQLALIWRENQKSCPYLLQKLKFCRRRWWWKEWKNCHFSLNSLLVFLGRRLSSGNVLSSCFQVLFSSVWNVVWKTKCVPYTLRFVWRLLASRWSKFQLLSRGATTAPLQQAATSLVSQLPATRELKQLRPRDAARDTQL